jgi:hypothetical protein
MFAPYTVTVAICKPAHFEDWVHSEFPCYDYISFFSHEFIVP